MQPQSERIDLRGYQPMENKQTYTYEEAYDASLQYFGGDELAARVWVNKYAMKDGFGNIFEKSPEQMHWRIANEIARIEKKYPNPHHTGRQPDDGYWQ